MASSIESSVKAALFNFVVYTETDRRVPYFHTVVDSVIEKFPCRILFVRGDPAGKEPIFRTEKLVKQSGTVSCDQIEIHATGKYLKEVPFFILPHLAPDLPIIALWGEDPTKESLVLSEILSHTKRLIIDSENSEDLKSFSRSMLKQREELPYTVVDMHWARIAGWRHVVASVFDTEERLEMIREAEEIHLVYNSRKTEAFSHPDISARYIEAWLASRLKWNSNSPKITLEGRAFEALLPAAIVELHISSKKGSSFHLARSSQMPRAVRVTETDAGSCSLPYTLPLSAGGGAPSFVKELLFAPSSSQYIEMLKYLKEIG